VYICLSTERQAKNVERDGANVEAQQEAIVAETSVKTLRSVEEQELVAEAEKPSEKLVIDESIDDDDDDDDDRDDAVEKEVFTQCCFSIVMLNCWRSCDFKCV